MNINEQKRIRVAIPTNDGINIFPKMLGMAKHFFIYEIENKDGFKFIEKRENPYAEMSQHLKTLDIYDLITDCSIIISVHIGKKGVTRLQEKGIKLFFKRGNIEQALTEIIKNI